jgi:hypothetical protein
MAKVERHRGTPCSQNGDVCRMVLSEIVDGRIRVVQDQARKVGVRELTIT